MSTPTVPILSLQPVVYDVDETSAEDNSVIEVDAWADDYRDLDEDILLMSDSDYGPYKYELGCSDGCLACMADMAGESH